MKVKLSDIASEMGISIAAVSMALNNKDGVSEETRDEVLKVAERLGYKFKRQRSENEAKKGFIKLLRIKKHGLVVMETAFFASVIEGIEEECRKMGYELLISNIILDKDDVEQIKREYHDDVEGLILLCTELDEEDIDKLIGINCPLVVLDRKFMLNINTVLMNNQKASRQAVNYLYQKGHREIGYLKSSKSIYNFDSRFKSYLEAIVEKGMLYNENHTIKLEPTIEGAFRDMKTYLDHYHDKLPSSFVADNDIIALGAMNAFKEYGIKVPEDVSIIGIDDMPFCTLISPQLTTIRIFKKEIGRQAVRLLIEEIRGENEATRKIEIDTVLIERGSVKLL